MKELLIVGARGWGREVYTAVIETEQYKSGKLKVKGFLDSKTDALDGLRGDYPPILCSPHDYEVQNNDIFFIALGDSMQRKKYAELIIEKGGNFYTYVSNKAFVNPTAQIGKGSFIAGFTTVSDNVTIGDHVIVHPFSSIGHDVKVGDYSTLLSYVFMGGYSEVGEMSTMNPKSMIIPHKRVGNNVSVGAGSVVIRNVKDGLSVHGNPAVKIKL